MVIALLGSGNVKAAGAPQVVLTAVQGWQEDRGGHAGKCIGLMMSLSCFTTACSICIFRRVVAEAALSSKLLGVPLGEGGIHPLQIACTQRGTHRPGFAKVGYLQGYNHCGVQASADDRHHPSNLRAHPRRGRREGSQSVRQLSRIPTRNLV